MNKALNIFLTIQELPDISQRQLAKKTGYSLGTINGLLQKMIDQEEIISKPITPNHYIYQITPSGAIHQAQLLYDFTLDGYAVIGRIRHQCKHLIQVSIHQGVRHFYLLGQKDAIYKLLQMSLIESRRQADIHYEHIEDASQIDRNKAYKVLVWNKEYLTTNEHYIHVLLES